MYNDSWVLHQDWLAWCQWSCPYPKMLCFAAVIAQTNKPFCLYNPAQPNPFFDADSIKLEAEKPRQDIRIFLQNLGGEGLGFEYVMFFNSAEKRVVTVYQPGPYLEGHEGFTRGGSIATMIDTTCGICSIFFAGKLMTASLSINFKNPILLGSVVLVDSRLDRMEGRKAFTSCQVWSCDGQTLHAEATALFIQVASPSQK